MTGNSIAKEIGAAQPGALHGERPECLSGARRGGLVDGVEGDADAHTTITS